MSGKLRSVAEYVRMSTDHQRYSLANQTALIRSYAAANEMEVVRSYGDPGRSGLTIRNRPGLSQLLADVVSQSAGFEAVLVYDVSRWGRFQDADESAHYEFLCKQAGVRVIYCAEQFASDGTPFANVLKSIKRAMAGEFSRELSVKVAAGKARLGALGYRVGGVAGYGLRRQILEDGARPSIVLRDGQRKSLQTDRVTLIPGPAEEIAVVKRIYRDYVYMRQSERQIAEALNAEGVPHSGNRPWSKNLVCSILTNEKYIGNNIVSRVSKRLKTKQIIKPPETWVRHDDAFEPLISGELFQAAGKTRSFNRKNFVTREAILQGLAGLLRREGTLSGRLIDRRLGFATTNAIRARFGSVGRAYEALGYEHRGQYFHHALERQIQVHARILEQELLNRCAALGGESCRYVHGRLQNRHGQTVSIRVSRHRKTRYSASGWRIRFRGGACADIQVNVRLAPCNERVQDFLVVAASALTGLPQCCNAENSGRFIPFVRLTSDAVAAALDELQP